MNAILDHHAAGADSALADLEKLWAAYLADENDATRKAFVDAADALALAPHDALAAAAAAQTERGAAQLAERTDGRHHGERLQLPRPQRELILEVNPCGTRFDHCLCQLKDIEGATKARFSISDDRCEPINIGGVFSS